MADLSDAIQAKLDQLAGDGDRPERRAVMDVLADHYPTVPDGDMCTCGETLPCSTVKIIARALGVAEEEGSSIRVAFTGTDMVTGQFEGDAIRCQCGFLSASGEGMYGSFVGHVKEAHQW